MALQVITYDGEAAIADAIANAEAATIDRFVLAHIPSQSDDTPAERDEPLAASEYQVWVGDVTRTARLGDNDVVFSLVLDSSVGDFEFNWVGLITTDDTLVAVRHETLQSKVKEDGAETGNNILRNFVLRASGVADAFNVTVTPETWQFDWTQGIQQVVADGTADLREFMENLDWTTLSGKPSEFPAEAHGHDGADISGTLAIAQIPTSTDYNDDATTRVPKSSTLKAFVTDAQNSLNGKAASSHTHSAANITSGTLGVGRIPTTTSYSSSSTSTVPLASAVNNLRLWVVGQLSGKAASSHNHSAANITSGTLGIGRVPTTTSYSSSSTSTVPLASAVNNLRAWVVGQLSGKAASSHNHSAANITSGTLGVARVPTTTSYSSSSTSTVPLASALNNLRLWVVGQLSGKAASSHTHSAANMTSGTLASARLPAPTTTARGGHKKATLESYNLSGYYRDNETGFLVQWGERWVLNVGTTHNFPIAFPNRCQNVLVSVQESSPVKGSKTDYVWVDYFNETSVRFVCGEDSSMYARYIAIGH